jgi:hypothetical protein
MNNKQWNSVHLYKFIKRARIEILGWKRVHVRGKTAYGNPALCKRKKCCLFPLCHLIRCCITLNCMLYNSALRAV